MKQLFISLLLIISIQVSTQSQNTYFEQGKIHSSEVGEIIHNQNNKLLEMFNKRYLSVGEQDNIYQNTQLSSTTQNSSLKSTYDSNGNITSSFYYRWDTDTNQWVIRAKRENTYDSNGNITFSFYYIWDININQWVNLSIFTYDTNGSITKVVYYNWNTNQWVNSSKDEFTYDSNGNITLYVEYNWNTNTNQWVNNSKDEFTYDSNGNVTLCVEYKWDTNTNQWVNNFISEYTYDSSGKRTFYYRNNWDSSTNQWVTYVKEVYNYDSNGNITSSFYYKWDTNTNQWVFVTKSEYTYDSDGNSSPTNLTLSNSIIDENLVVTTEVGTLTSTDEYTNDTHTYSLITGVGDDDNSSFTITNDKLLSGEVFDFETKSSYSIRIQTDDGNSGTFSKFFTISVNSTLGITDFFNENVKVYPNPITENSFTIETPFSQTIQLHLLDIHGRTILSRELPQNINKISLDGISDGLYFVQLIDENKVVHQQKIIKRN